jgi:DNA-binding response OmpR family regulator
MPAPSTTLHVLVLVEDPALGELLFDLLAGAGHRVEVLELTHEVTAVDGARFDAIVVDLDTRARHEGRLLRELRRTSPRSRIVALLRCGALAVERGDALHTYDVGLPKPARLGAILAALVGVSPPAAALA